MSKLSKALCAVFSIAIGLALCPCLAVHATANGSPLSQWVYTFMHKTVPAAFADDESDDSQEGDEGDEGQDEEETPIEKVKRLIKGLKEDPYNITEADRSDIDEARSAYDELSAEEQQELDQTEISGEETYGRRLESCEWGLLALQAVYGTLDVIDGDYSEYVSSVSSMGKSTSARKRAWNVVSLTVQSGQVTALVRCETDSPRRFMRIGGFDYVANVVDGVPEFEVPVDVNATNTFLVRSNDISKGFPVQLQVMLPLDPASASEVEAAKSNAQDRLSSDLSVYTDESAAAIKTAARALMEAASKSGVSSIELAIAAKPLDDAVANAVKKEKKKEEKSDGKGSAAKKKSKSDKKKSSSSKDSSSSKSSSSASSASSKPATAATTGRTAVVPTVTNSSTASSSKNSKSAASASAVSAESQSSPSVQQAIQPASSTSKANNEFLTKALVVLAALSVLLVGMCARTILFMRAKEVA